MSCMLHGERAEPWSLRKRVLLLGQGKNKEEKVRELVGVSMAWLTQKGQFYSRNEKISGTDQDNARTCRRLYAAVVLLDIINEVQSSVYFCVPCGCHEQHQSGNQG